MLTLASEITARGVNAPVTPAGPITNTQSPDGIVGVIVTEADPTEQVMELATPAPFETRIQWKLVSTDAPVTVDDANETLDP